MFSHGHFPQFRQMACENCNERRAMLLRPKDRSKVCKECFYALFEQEVHETIVQNALFKPGEKVAVAVSGGKDSTVLAHVLNLLNERHSYGLELYLLSVDEGIAGYRDHSLDTVRQNKEDYGLPLKIVSYREVFGVTMDEVVARVGRKSNCTFCGVFRRQSLERGALGLGVDQIATGHNADDMAETVLLNMMRGDYARMRKCTAVKSRDSKDFVTRTKPLAFMYEKEIVMYAFYKGLKFFSTECTYSPGAARGLARMFIKEVEKRSPDVILNLIRSGQAFASQAAGPENVFRCVACGSPTSIRDNLCKGCVLLKSIANL